MGKFYVLGCIFVIINSFENAIATSERMERLLRGRNKKVETFVDIVKKNGYLAEERFITTEDGYILSLNRMFGGPKSPPAPKKSPILFIHGMIASADVWVMRGPEKDLVYLLADQGYDIWALNLRGNTYSRNNIKISPNSPEFWRFSWHENGIYDTPSAIDYILEETGQSKLTLIGHSMGSTVSYVLLSIRPEYNKKIDLAISLAPVAIFTRQFRGLLSIVIRFGQEVMNSFRRNGIYEILSRTEFLPQLITETCGRPGTLEICRAIIFLASGSADPEQFDDSLTSTLVSRYPAGTSVDTVDHYIQNIVNASFREFDFGMNGNYARYGSPFPPEYPLWKITAPVLMYSGLNDLYAIPADVKALVDRLPNVVASKVIPFEKFNHFDFVISKDAKKLLYDDVIDVINIYKTEGNGWF